MVLRDDDAVSSRRFRRAEDGAQVPRILDLIEGQEEGWFPPICWDRQDLLEIRVARSGDAGDDTLVMRGAGHRRQLIPGAKGHPDAPTFGEDEQFLQGRASALSQDGDLLHSPAIGAQQLQH